MLLPNTHKREASAWLGSLLMIAVTSAMPVAALAGHGDGNVGIEVYDELARADDGTAYVIVILSPTRLRPGESQVQLQARVEAIQNDVLAGLSDDEFEPVYRYRNFAAMTGVLGEAGLAALSRHFNVIKVGLDGTGEAHLASSVPFINGDDAYDLGFTGGGITVAVLDTGIDTDHDDLKDNLADGAYHFLGGGANQGPGAEDDHGHGTNVSGIITSKGDVAYKGVAPDTDILTIKVLNSLAKGYISDFAAGVDYVVTHKNDYDNLCAINMSLGTNALYDECPCDDVDTDAILLQAAIQAAEDVHIVTFASSGNSGSSTSMCAPACVSSAIAVAAVYDADYGREPDSGYYSTYYDGFDDCCDNPTYGDLITCFSNRSGCNRLAGPGRRVAGPAMGGGVDSFGWTGTSQAAPHCTAVAALLADKWECYGCYLPPASLIADIMELTGAPTDDPEETVPNPIRVDALEALNTIDVFELSAGDGQNFDMFGDSVDTYDQWIVVGAEAANDSGARRGAAYVYQREGRGWISQAKLTAMDSDADHFGHDVSIDDDWIVVGSHWDDGAAYRAGAAYVFQRQGASWYWKQKLTASDHHSEDEFGTSVAISGDRLVVGSPFDDDAGGQSGSAYVFRREGTTWTEEDKLTADDEDWGDYFGHAVAIDGSYIVIGAYRDEDGGSVYVFKRNDNGTPNDPTDDFWQEQDKLTPSGATADEFGWSVAISGDRIVVGAYLEDLGNNEAGAVYVFRREGSDWVEETRVGIGGVEDWLGYAVDIAGDRFAAAAPLDDDNGTNAGAVHVFERIGTSWFPLAKLTAWEEAIAWDQLGRSVAMSESHVVTGETADNYWTGVAYAFGGVDDCNDNGVLDVFDIAGGGSSDSDDNGIPDECEHPADVNGDGVVDIDDVFAVLGAWGPCSDCPEDVNGDGGVDIDDLFEILANWGPCD